MVAKQEDIAQAAPANGARIPIHVAEVIDMGGGRQLTLQTHIDRDLSEVDQHEFIDKLVRLGERQRCRVDCDGIERELEENRKTLGNLQDDWARLEHNHAAKTTGLKEQIALARQEVESIEANARVAWNESGRRGEFTMNSGVKARVSQANSAAASYEATLNSAQADRDAAVGNYEVSCKRIQQQIVKLEVELAQKRTKAGLDLPLAAE
jgi:hypothetical protein